MSLSARGPAECGAADLLFVGHASSNGRASGAPWKDREEESGAAPPLLGTRRGEKRVRAV